jgi:hypothetical protein
LAQSFAPQKLPKCSHSIDFGWRLARA